MELDETKNIPFDGGDKITLTKINQKPKFGIWVEYHKKNGMVTKFEIPFETENKMNHYFDNDGGGFNLKKYLDFLIKNSPEDGLYSINFDDETLEYDYSYNLHKMDINDINNFPSEQLPDILVNLLNEVTPISVKDYKTMFNGYINALNKALEIMDNIIGTTDEANDNIENMKSNGYNPELYTVLNNLAGYSKGIDYAFELISNGMNPDMVDNETKMMINSIKKKIKIEYNIDYINKSEIDLGDINIQSNNENDI